MSYAEELRNRLPEAEKLVKTNPTEALKLVLNEMPVRPKKVIPADQEKTMPKEEQEKLLSEARSVAATNVINTILAVDKAKLNDAIKGLSDDDRDTLMKYVYLAFADESREKDYQYLLTIHDAICKVSNLGPIIRTIHTRLQV